MSLRDPGVARATRFFAGPNPKFECLRQPAAYTSVRMLRCGDLDRITFLAVAAVVLLAAASAHADIVHLKNGKTLHGEVVKEDAETVTIKVPFGEVKLKRSDIELIERQSALEYRLDLGRNLLQQRNYERAVTALEEAFISNRTSNEAKRALANALEVQGNHYRNLHRFAEARNAFEKLLKIDPNAEVIPHGGAKALGLLQEQEQGTEVLVQKARRFVLTEEWTRAIEAYEDCITYTPDVRQTISADMAKCYINRAVELARAGQAVNAAADLEAALKLDPTQADSLEKFYTSCALPGILGNLQTGNASVAQVDLKRVLSFAPTNKSVLYVAGRLEEALGRVPGAADCYARALRTRVGNPTPEYTASLRQTLEKELQLENNKWTIDTEFVRREEFSRSNDGPASKLESENFIVFHYNEALAKQLIEAAEYHRTRIMAELNFAQVWQKEKAKVYLHRTQAEYTANTGQPEWTGGYSRFNMEGMTLTNPQIHSWQTSPRLLKSVLPHEVAHLCINSNLPNFTSLPKCLHEGFAVLMEPQFRKDYFLNFLKIRVKSQDFIPLADLLATKEYPRDPEFFYAEGYAILEFLVQQKGLTPVASLLKSAHQGTAAADLIKISGAQSAEELEEAWKKWILGDGKRP
jgi:tetratricopeptide (TPR) repeat protein